MLLENEIKITEHMYKQQLCKDCKNDIQYKMQNYAEKPERHKSIFSIEKEKNVDWFKSVLKKIMTTIG